MRILLNGEPHDLPAPLTVLALLETLSIDPRLVAVEHNRVVVKRDRYAETLVDEGAEVEIVAFVGGGSPRAFAMLLPCPGPSPTARFPPGWSSAPGSIPPTK